MIIPIHDLGDFGTNCYIAAKDGSAVLIDAPYSAGIIADRLEKEGLELKTVLLTHGHCDHIEALNGLYEKYGCKVYIHPADAGMLKDPVLCLADFFGTPFKPFYGALPLPEGSVEGFEIVKTPGHSPGSVCYCMGDVIFTGDTLFEGSIGRTDLGGDYRTLMKSIEKLYGLGKNFRILPGHGGESDLDAELRFNPWLDEIREKY